MKRTRTLVSYFLLTFLLAPFLIRSCYWGQGSGRCECTKSGASLDTRYLFFNVPWYFLAINCIVEELFLQTLLENNCFLWHTYISIYGPIDYTIAFDFWPLGFGPSLGQILGPPLVSRVPGARLLSADWLTLTGEPPAVLPSFLASCNRFDRLDLKLI